MKKANGKSESEMAGLDLEHELPAGDGDDRASESAPSGAAAGETSGVGTELQKLKSERDSLLDRLARAQAEFENARRRAVKEQQDFRDYAAADAIKPLLPVIDSFERALKAPAGDSDDLRSGLELIYRQFQDALQKMGVRPIESVGKPFDPRVHEAIEMVDTNEAEDHHVLDELQRGYNYKGRLLRPAMVRVARNTSG